MCRYAMYGPYKEKWACFSCRKSFKQTSRWESARPIHPVKDSERLVRCPHCGERMHNMGLDFKAPSQTDGEQWQKVAMLFANGYKFSSCGCDGPGPRPARLKEVAAFLEAQKMDAMKLRRRQQVQQRAAETNTQRKKKRKQLESKRFDRILNSRNKNPPRTRSERPTALSEV